MFITMNLTAGQRVEFREQFDFVRVMDAASPLTLDFFRQEREVDEAANVVSGYSESFTVPCDRLVLINGATAQSVTFATRLGSRVAYDRPPTGAVEIVKNTARRGMAIVTSQVIGTASTVVKYQLLGRNYWAIQNNAQVNVWLTFSGAAPLNAVVGQGLKLEPGDFFEMSDYVHTGCITAIAEGSAAATFHMEGGD